MADNGERQRPSFASFLRRSRDALAGHKTASILQNIPKESGQEPSNNPSTDPKDDQAAKALHRRQQVRRAQIQHRERKATYVRELELDVTRTRDMIALATQECAVLRAENDGLRARLSAAAATTVPQHRFNFAFSEPAPVAGGVFDDINVDDIDDVTLSLSVDEVMHTPCFQISSSPSERSFGATSLDWVPKELEGRRYALPEMTAEQTQLAVNFILALEHTCWSHFHYPDFDSTAASTGAESGHILMASALALHAAPQPVFDRLDAAKHAFGPPKSRSGPTSPPPNEISWQVSGLTLKALHALAGSLSPPDLELTPVQAFFEIAGLYSVELLLSPDVYGALKREFVGVVKCKQYGAAIERVAFESILARVVGTRFV